MNLQLTLIKSTHTNKWVIAVCDWGYESKEACFIRIAFDTKLGVTADDLKDRYRIQKCNSFGRFLM